MYQCTWRGCNVRMDVCSDIERHVRRKHLHRPDPVNEEDNDHEEEFYYTEIDVPLHLNGPIDFSRSSSTTSSNASTPTTVSVATPLTLPILADHMDMARPPHENPEYYGRSAPTAPTVALASVRAAHSQLIQRPRGSGLGASRALPIAIPVTNIAFNSSMQIGPSAMVSPIGAHT